jgi:ketosteroid isomerase-like protein
MTPSIYRLPLLLLAAASLSAVDPARAEPPIVQLHKDKGVFAHPGLDALYQRFSKAFGELDVDGASGVYSDDAMYLIPGEELRSGRPAIRESFAKAFQTHRQKGRQLFLRFGIVQRRVDGNQAYDVGYGNLSVSSKDGYYSQSSFKFVVVARRLGRDDGSWRWQVDSWSGLQWTLENPSFQPASGQ